jgi:hypothetical protein
VVPACHHHHRSHLHRRCHRGSQLGDEEEDSDNEEFLAQLPTNAEAEDAAEQRAILVSFETQRHDQSEQKLMAAERRAVAARMAEEHAAARADAHRHNIEAARAAMADVAGGLATGGALHLQLLPRGRRVPPSPPWDGFPPPVQ